MSVKCVLSLIEWRIETSTISFPTAIDAALLYFLRFFLAVPKIFIRQQLIVKFARHVRSS